MSFENHILRQHSEERDELLVISQAANMNLFCKRDTSLVKLDNNSIKKQ